MMMTKTAMRTMIMTSSPSVTSSWLLFSMCSSTGLHILVHSHDEDDDVDDEDQDIDDDFQHFISTFLFIAF